jgi:peptidylamidoglycolate lyase
MNMRTFRPALPFIFLALAILFSREFHSAAAAPDSYQVVHGWPALPDGFVLGQVSGVAVDSHNHVFVFHRGSHPWTDSPDSKPIAQPVVLCFEGGSGKQIAAWGQNRFLLPHGLRVDSHDNIWVTDVALHQVFKFSHDGTLLMTLGAARAPGLDGAHFNKPTDVAIAPDGTIYVSDGYVNSRVALFSPDGKFLGEWGHKGSALGEFDLPHGITLDSQGRIYVADRSNARIQVIDPAGKFLYAWKSPELGRPFAVTAGPDGYLYVVDGGDLNPEPPDHGGILRLDLSGKILDRWSRHGNYDGQLYIGHDVAVGKDGAVYVGDILGQRVQKFVRK